MDVIEAITKRRTIRKFLEVPVEWEKVGQIIDAARYAPSSGNLQSWAFIVVRENETKRKIAEAALQQYWIESAPLLIVIVAELKKIRQYYGVRGERLYAVQNCACASMNMMLTAEALGLGTAWVGAFDENALSRILNIPDDVRPQAIIAVGYPDEKPHPPHRDSLEKVTFLEGYSYGSTYSLHKMKDVDMVLWNVRLGERAYKMGKEVVDAMGPLSKRQKEKLLPVLKKKLAERIEKRKEVEKEKKEGKKKK